MSVTGENVDGIQATTVDDPVPEAVRQARHIHVMPAHSMGSNDFGQGALAQEAQERAFWLGLRQVIREEMRNDPTDVDPKMEKALDAIKSSIADAIELQKSDPDKDDEDDDDVMEQLEAAADAIDKAIECQSQDSEEEDEGDDDEDEEDEEDEKSAAPVGASRSSELVKGEDGVLRPAGWPSPHAPYRPWSLSTRK